MRTAICTFTLILLYPFTTYAACVPESVSFSGSVKDGQNYNHAIAPGLIFYLDYADTGWTIRIAGPRAPKFDDYDENYIDYIYPVTPPYRMNPTQYLDGSYNQKIETGDIREFEFLLNADDSVTAELALQKVLWSKTDKDQEDGLAIIDQLPRGSGTLTITDAKSVTSGDETKYTDLSFTADLIIPSAQNCR